MVALSESGVILTNIIILTNILIFFEKFRSLEYVNKVFADAIPQTTI